MLPNSLTRFALQMLNSDQKSLEPNKSNIEGFDHDYFAQLISYPVDQFENHDCSANSLQTKSKETRVRLPLKKKITKIHQQEIKDGTVIACRCVKSQCQKQYCECYSFGIVCGDQCQCQNCGNQSNPTTPSKKIVSFCSCKRSGCVKKYCDCYINGRPCNQHCKCEGCFNCDHVSIQGQLTDNPIGNNHLIKQINSMRKHH